MLKKTVSYTNFNDEEVTEDHYFHLSKAELVEMELSVDGGLSKHLERVVASENGGEIMRTFKTLLLDSYGQKSPDGRSFTKNQEIKDAFASSEAYSQIFMELVTDAEAAAEFVNGIVPRGLEEEVAQFQKEQDKPDLPTAREQPLGVRAAVDPIEPTEQRVLSMAEAQAMPSEELQRLLASGSARIASTEG